MAEPLVLTYNLDDVTAERFAALCRRQQIRCRAVRHDEYALPIGALAGIPVARAQKAAAAGGFGDPMLVMCHMLGDQLDAFLRGMRDEGLPRVALKAVLTPSNVTWNSCRLRDELAREHAAMNTRP